MLLRSVQLMVRCTVGGLFLTAGALKAWDTQQFAQDLQHYAWTKSGDLILLTAVYLPWLEICAAVCLLTRRLYLGGLVTLLALDGVFLVALSSAWARGLDITCGCFGREENGTNFPLRIGRDLALLAAIFFLMVLEWRRRRAARDTLLYRVPASP